jgi:hypothetical protein
VSSETKFSPLLTRRPVPAAPEHNCQHELPMTQTGCVDPSDPFTKMHGIFARLLPKTARVTVEEVDQTPHASRCAGWVERDNLDGAPHRTEGLCASNRQGAESTDWSWHSSKLQRLLVTSDRGLTGRPTEHPAPWPWLIATKTGKMSGHSNELQPPLVTQCRHFFV